MPPRGAREAIGVLVGNRHGQPVEQLGDRGVGGRGVRELRKHDQANRQERRASGHRRVDHLQHAVGVRAHLAAISGIRQIRLACGGSVADGLHI